MAQYTLNVTNFAAESTTGWTSNSTFSSTSGGRSGNKFEFTAFQPATVHARQDLIITTDAANTAIDANNAAAYISWWQSGADDADTGTIQLKFMNGASFLANTNLNEKSYGATWTQLNNGAKIPYGTRKIRVEIQATRGAGNYLNVYFDDLSNVTISTGYVETNVSSIYTEVVTDLQYSNVNVASIYTEAFTDLQYNTVNVSSIYTEALTDVQSTNANVYQMYAEVIIGTVRPRVLVAGGA